MQTNDQESVRLSLRIPGLRVTVPVEIERIVWEWFDGQRAAVRVSSNESPIATFQHFLGDTARSALRSCLEEGRSMEDAIAEAGRIATHASVPIAFVWRAAEVGRQLGATDRRSTFALVSQYLAARPAHESAVRGALTAGMLPSSVTPSVCRILVDAEAVVARWELLL